MQQKRLIRGGKDNNNNFLSIVSLLNLLSMNLRCHITCSCGATWLHEGNKFPKSLQVELNSLYDLEVHV